MNVAELLEPLAPGGATGVDARYVPQHQSLRAEFRKEESAHGETPDWDAISRDGAALLRDTSKDLLVAAYVAVGWFELHGLPGLAHGIALVDGLLCRYWEGLFPEKKRHRARLEAVRWFLERVSRGLEVRSHARPISATADQLACEAAVSRLETTLGARFGADAPTVRPLRDRLQAMVQGTSGAPAPATATAPASSIALTESAAGGGAAQSDATLAIDALKGNADPSALLLHVSRQLIASARALLQACPSEAASYRLIRLAVELPLRQCPAVVSVAEDARTTAVEGPPATIRAQLETLRQHGRWAALLEESESAVAQWRCWLDPHFMSAAALRGLGRECAAVAVEVGLRPLLERLPDLVRLHFADGEPFAASATAEWIAQSILRNNDNRATNGGNAAPADEPAEAAAGDDADLLSQLYAVTVEAGGRALFLKRLSLASRCVEEGQGDVARKIFAALLREAEVRSLEGWEPVLMSDMLGRYIGCVGRGRDKGDSELRERLSAVRSLIDPVGSLGFSPRPRGGLTHGLPAGREQDGGRNG